jgi:hypothetical protein
MSEHDRDTREPGPHPAVPHVDVDVEDPEADVLEQHLPTRDDTEIDDDPYRAPAPPEADPADAVEQRRAVTIDEDDLPPEE